MRVILTISPSLKNNYLEGDIVKSRPSPKIELFSTVVKGGERFCRQKKGFTPKVNPKSSGRERLFGKSLSEVGTFQMMQEVVELLVKAGPNPFLFHSLKLFYQLFLFLRRKVEVGDDVEDIVLFVNVLG